MSDWIQCVQISFHFNRGNGVSSLFVGIFFFKETMFSSLFRAAIFIGRPLMLPFIEVVKNFNWYTVLP